MTTSFNLEDYFTSEKFNFLTEPNDIPEEIKLRGFAYPKFIKTEGVLFIGLNPSFRNGDKMSENSFYTDDNYEDDRYFKKFHELVPPPLEYSHLDLLGIRETSQNGIRAILNSKENEAFVLNQLSMAKKIIEKAQPKIIVVVNSISRELMGLFNDNQNPYESFAFKFYFDSEIGTYRIKENEQLQDKPVFFSSMLTGQRALDLGSFGRLKWHIEWVCQKEFPKPEIKISE